MKNCLPPKPGATDKLAHGLRQMGLSLAETRKLLCRLGWSRTTILGHKGTLRVYRSRFNNEDGFLVDIKGTFLSENELIELSRKWASSISS